VAHLLSFVYCLVICSCLETCSYAGNVAIWEQCNISIFATYSLAHSLFLVYTYTHNLENHSITRTFYHDLVALSVTPLLDDMYWTPKLALWDLVGDM